MTTPTFTDLLAGNRDAVILAAFIILAMIFGGLLGYAFGRSRRDEIVEALDDIRASIGSLVFPLIAMSSGRTLKIAENGYLQMRDGPKSKAAAPLPDDLGAALVGPADPPMPKATPLKVPGQRLRGAKGRFVSAEQGRRAAGKA